MIRHKMLRAARYALYGCLALLGGLLVARADISTATNWIMGASNVPLTDCSGTITSGGTAQNAIAALTAVHGFIIQDLSTTDALWISFTTTAAATTAGSYMLQPATATVAGGSFTSPVGFGTNHAVSIIGATTSDKFSCTWW